MSRNLFLLITALLAAIFGLMMFFVPSQAAAGFGFAPDPQSIALFRALGAMILATGALNFLVRGHADNPTLAAVLVTNVLTHGLSLVADLWAVAAGTLAFSAAAPGQIVHLFVGLGSLYYWSRMDRS